MQTANHLVNEYKMIRAILTESQRILLESRYLILRTATWSARMLLKNYMIAKKSLPALATLSNLAMLEDAQFNLVAQSLRGMVPVASRAKAMDPKKVGIALQHGAIFLALLMIPVGMSCLFARDLFQLCLQSEATLDASTRFFQKIFLTVLFDGFYRLEARTLIGVGNTHWPLYADIIESLSDIMILALLLWQSENTIDANAFALSSFIAAVFGTAYLFFSKECEDYHFFRFNHGEFSLETLKEVTHYCLPQGIAGMMELGSQTVVTALCGIYGNNALIADAVAKSYTQLLLPITAIATKAGVLITESVNANDGKFRIIGNANYFINGSYTALCCFFLFTCSHFFVHCFVDDDKKNETAFQMALTFTTIIAIRESFNTIKSAGTSALVGYGDKTYAPVVNIIFTSILNAALAYLATIHYKTNETTMYKTQILGYCFASLLVVERWYHCDHLEKSLFYRAKNRISTGIMRCSSLWKTENPATAEVREMEEGERELATI